MSATEASVDPVITPESTSGTRSVTTSGVKRGPKPKGTLSAEIVARAGLAILDRRGPTHFSLRGVAAELGIRPNAIYTYAASRARLEQLVVDLVIAEADITLLDPDAGLWNERLEAFALALRGALIDHPGAAPLLMAAPLDGPHALAMGEALLAVLMEAGLNGPDAARAVWPLLVYVIGSVSLEVSDAPGTGTGLPAEADRVVERRQRFAELDDATLPRLYAARMVIARWPSTQQFVWGLERLLAGLLTASPR